MGCERWSFGQLSSGEATVENSLVIAYEDPQGLKAGDSGDQPPRVSFRWNEGQDHRNGCRGGSMMRGLVRSSISMHLRELVHVGRAGGWMVLHGSDEERIFPEFDLDRILVTVPYRERPQEVEEGVGQKIEKRLEPLRASKGDDRSTGGACNVVLELVPSGRSPDRVLDEVRSEVDRIPSFPVEAEQHQISLVTNRRPSLRVRIIGPQAADATGTISVDSECNYGASPRRFVMIS